MVQWHIRWICIVVFFFFSSSMIQAQEEETIVQITASDFTEGKVVELDSVWTFYWKQLLEPKDSREESKGTLLYKGLHGWSSQSQNNTTPSSYGYGTYVSRLILPDLGSSIALQLPKINSSAKVWIDGHFVFESGKVGTERRTTRHFRKKAIIPIHITRDTTEIVIQVANFYHTNGGITRPIILGETYLLWTQNKKETIADMVLIGSLLFIGFSFLILYFAYWRIDRAILYFSLFCLAWGYRNLSDGYAPIPTLFENIPWIWHVKFEYISLFIGALMGSLFLNKIFKEYFSLWYVKLNQWLVWSFVSITCLLPGNWLSYTLPLFFALITVNVLYVGFKLIRIKKDLLESRIALGGIFLAVAVLVYHMVIFNFYGQSNSILVNVGYLIVFMINSLLLGKRFSLAFQSLRLLQHQTKMQNKEIAFQARELNQLNEGLEKKISERTQELKKAAEDLKDKNVNLEQFNYIVSHNLRAPLANINGLLKIYNHDNPSDGHNKLTLEKLEESCFQLDSVLRDLTKILEVKNKDYPKEAVIFSEIIEKITNSIEDEIIRSETEIIQDLEVDQLMSVSSFWYSIFYNLISNAIKYKKPDQNCQITISSKKTDSGIQIIFEDNGLGIDMNKHEGKVFGLYKRFHTHIEGRGMGLFMIKAQIEALGGTIDLHSEPDKGTRFTISFCND